jgi:signal transduction histidine kinase
MDRIEDKLIVLLCCLPTLALVSVSAGTVVAVLVAVGATALAEVLWAQGGAASPKALGLARLSVPLAYLALSCFDLAGALFSALAVYDLARDRRRAPLALVVIIPLAAAAALGTPGVALAVSCCACIAAALLSLRTTNVVYQRARNLSDRDSLRELSLSLETKNRDLLDRREYESQLATLTERSRIAREIHDNTGHLLTRAIVQVEALRVVHAGDEQIEQEFQSVSDTLKEAYETMRESVHRLADESCDLSVRVRQVVDETCADTGLATDCRIAAGQASQQVTTCLVAVVREALSNTLRHAVGATRVDIELVEHPGMWRLTVRDDGKPPQDGSAPRGPSRPSSPSVLSARAIGPAGELDRSGRGGMGLLSMEERVRALGGTLSAGYSDAAHGFVVNASIPKKEAS